VASTAGRPWATLFWHALEGRFIRRADAVFTVSPSIAERLATMYGIPSPAVLYNVPEWQDVARSDRLREVIGVPTDQAIVLHQGNVQHGRGAETLVEAMRQVRGAALVFLGGGAGRSALEVRVRENGIRHVHFLDAVPPADLLPITASADIGVTLLEDNCLNHHFALPNKLFEYLMAGLPVVGSDLPEIRRVVAGFDVGTLVDAGDPAAVAGGIQALLDDPERRAACAARARPACETFRWERASEPFVRTYRRLLEARPK
jgi:glycosyltransferase involved in cell wall biosynthesis